MKTAVKVLKWIGISLIFQISVLALLNYYYFTETSSIRVSTCEMNRDIELPEHAKQIKASFDGMYAGYVLDGKLEIVDLLSKKVVKTIYDDKDVLSYYKWLPDRNVVIYSFRAPDNQAGYIRLSTFYINNEERHDYPIIGNLPCKSEVEGIEVSPLTNVVYVKIKINDQKISIYKFDIADRLSYIMNVDVNTAIMEMNFSDELIYSNKSGIFVRNNKNAASLLPLKNGIQLLAIDAEDNIYAGEPGEDGKVTRIHVGRVSGETAESWRQITLERPIVLENIFVARNGTIYEIADGERKIKKIGSSRSVDYKGGLVEIIDDFIVSRNVRKLVFTGLK